MEMCEIRPRNQHLFKSSLLFAWSKGKGKEKKPLEFFYFLLHSPSFFFTIGSENLKMSKFFQDPEAFAETYLTSSSPVVEEQLPQPTV